MNLLGAAGVTAAIAIALAARRIVVPLGVGPGARRAVELTGLRGEGAAGDVAIAGSSCPAWFAELVQAADLRSPGRWWRVLVVGAAVAAVGAHTVGGPPFALLAGTGTFGGVVGGLRANGHRRARRVAQSVPSALDAVARSCRAGASVLGALRDLATTEVGPAGPVLAGVAARVDHGVSLRDALDELVARHPVAPVRLAAAALLVGADTGAAPGRAVDGVAATIRDHLALEREAAAQATQARTSAAVLVLAPLGFTVFAVLADPRVATFLFRTPVGLLCVALGGGLDALGAWWMSRLVRGPT